MLIASWNVNSIRMRLNQVLLWLENKNPDVLCLQETKVFDTDFPFESFKKSNFYQPTNVASQDIKTIGIVAIGKEFTAQIDLASIELY